MKNTVTTRDKTYIPLGKSISYLLSLSIPMIQSLCSNRKGYNRVNFKVTRSKYNDLQNNSKHVKSKLFQFIRKQTRYNNLHITVKNKKIQMNTNHGKNKKTTRGKNL